MYVYMSVCECLYREREEEIGFLNREGEELRDNGDIHSRFHVYI